MSAPFAIFTAQNILVRLTFSDLYDFFTVKRQNAQKDDPLALRCIAIQSQQTFDSEMLRIRFEADRNVSQNILLSDVETSENFSKQNTETEKQNQKFDLIWINHHLLNLDYEPSISARDFAAEKGPLKGVFIDLFFCTKAFVKRFGINLQNFHARFNFFF